MSAGNFIFKGSIFLCSLFFTNHILSQTIQGKIMEEDNTTPIPYVKIVNQSKVIAITDKSGDYKIHNVEKETVLTFENFLYKTKTLKVSQLIENPNIILTKDTVLINEVSISPFKNKFKLLGIKNKSVGGISFFDGKKGKEIVYRFDFKRYSELMNFSFYVHYSSTDKLIPVRFNIYEVDGSEPGKLLLSINEKITFQRGKWVTIDLKNYNLILNKGAFIGIQWVEDMPNQDIQIGGNMINRPVKTWYRRSEEEEFQKAFLNFVINMKIKY